MKIIPDFLRLNSGENISRSLTLDVSDFSRGFTYKLCFITPLGKLYVTDELSCPDGKGEYKLPSVLLDGRGVLYCQLHISGGNGFVIKSEIYEFPVYSSCDDFSHPEADGDELKSVAELFGLLEGKSDISHTHGEYVTRNELSSMAEIPKNVSQLNNDAGYVTGSEMNAALSGKSDAAHNHSGMYYTEDEVDDLVSSARFEALTLVQDHNHDDVYSKKNEVTELLDGKSDVGHNHDGTYYTETEVDDLVSEARLEALNLVQSHNHDDVYSKKNEVTELLDGKSDVGHNHDGTYYTETEVDDLVSEARLEALNLVQSHNHDDVYSKKNEVNGLLDGKSDVGHNHDGTYYTETEVDDLVSEARLEALNLVQSHNHDDVYSKKNEVNGLLDGKSDVGHNHDGTYYTETEVDDLVSEARLEALNLVQSHNHDDVYSKKNEVNGLLDGKSDVGHNHDGTYYTETEVDDLVSEARLEALNLVQSHNHDDVYSKKNEVNGLLDGKSDVGHNHDGTYYTETEVDDLVSEARLEALNLVQSHNHDDVYSKKNEVTELLDGKSDAGHTHGEYLTAEDIPENVSAFNNDAGYINESTLNDAVKDFRSVLLVTGKINFTNNDIEDVSHTFSQIEQAKNDGVPVFFVADISQMYPGGSVVVPLQLIESGSYAVFAFIIDFDEQSVMKGTIYIMSDSRYSNLTITSLATSDAVSSARLEALTLIQDHNHNATYYTEAEVNSLLSGKSDTSHTHDGRYYTETEVNSLLSGKSDASHTHDGRYYTESEVDSKLSGKSDSSHTHWYLTPINGGVNTVMMTSGGNLYPYANEAQQLGTTASRWSWVMCKAVDESSDERLKENFDTDMDKYVKMLDLLEPASYHFKSEAGLPDRKRSVGYVAQRVQEALSAVGLEDRDFAGLRYDKDGESRGEYTYGLAYSQFIPILHAKIRQLEEKYNEKIEELDKKIASLQKAGQA